MTSVVYHPVLKPPKIIFIASSLLFIEVGTCMFLTALLQEPLFVLIIGALMHLYFIGLSNREPHINNILRNKYLYLFEMGRMKDKGSPHFKTPTMYKDETEFYYEL